MYFKRVLWAILVVVKGVVETVLSSDFTAGLSSFELELELVWSYPIAL